MALKSLLMLWFLRRAEHGDQKALKAKDAAKTTASDNKDTPAK